MRNKEIWLFLFLFGMLLFNWPFLDIFSMSLPAYLFGTWAVFIILVGILIRSSLREDNNDV
jgi:hypothetical protein